MRLPCDGVPDGRRCHSWVNRDQATQRGWRVVLTYNLIDGSDSEHRNLCKRCARRLENFIFGGSGD